MGSSPATGLLWKLGQVQVPAQDCLHPPVKTQGQCQVGATQNHRQLPASLESGHVLVGLWTRPTGASGYGPGVAVELSQASFVEGKLGAALPHPQTLPRHWAADASVRKGWMSRPPGAMPQPHHPALIDTSADPPLLPAQNLLLYEFLITETTSHLLAIPSRFLIYLSMMSANAWPKPCGRPTGLPHPPTRPAHHSQALGDLAQLLPPN